MRNEKPIVTFTFDDIPDSALANGARVLSSRGVCGTFYVAGELCGTEHFGWRFSEAKDLSELVNEGHEIGCHTYSHKDVQTLDRKSIAQEIDANREFFAKLDHRVRLDNFAYPYGSVGFPQKWPLQKDFHSCRGVRSGINVGWIDLGLLRAVQLYDDVLDHNTIDRLIQDTCRLKGWLIFYTHDVANMPTDQGCSPELLDYTVYKAKQMGCECLTVREALSRIDSKVENTNEPARS